MMKLLPILLIATAAFGNAVGQRKTRPASVLLNTNKPGVYISFLRSGKIEPLETGVSNKYLWFRITNNTRWAILLEMSGVPKVYGDASLYFTIVESKGGKISIDSRCHVCTVNSVGPGRTVVFSIPADYATRDTFLRLEYSFAWERDHENEGGSSSTHAIEFYFRHLPRTALSETLSNNSLDRSGGIVFCDIIGAAKVALIRAARSTLTLGVFNSRKDVRMSLWVHWKERKGGRSLYLLDVPFELAFLLVGIVIVLLVLLVRRVGLF